MIRIHTMRSAADVINNELGWNPLHSVRIDNPMDIPDSVLSTSPDHAVPHIVLRSRPEPATTLVKLDTRK